MHIYVLNPLQTVPAVPGVVPEITDPNSGRVAGQKLAYYEAAGQSLAAMNEWEINEAYQPPPI